MLFIFFLLGLIFGSFFNVVILRLPIGKSIVLPRSTCGECHHTLNGIDMIPVLSYLIFSGKCRYCGTKYSIRYPLIELLTGILFAASYQIFGFTIQTLIGVILSSFLVIITFIDIDHQIIFDRFSVLIIILGISYQAFVIKGSFVNPLLGFLLGGGFLLLVSIIGTMGGGDIKIMASLGILLGLEKTGLALYLSFIIGAMVMLPFVIRKKRRTGTYNSIVPFGPFLCIGSWIAYHLGDKIIDYYIGFFQ